MKYCAIFLTILMMPHIAAASQWQTTGERLTYTVKWSFITAGEAELAFQPPATNHYRIVARAWTHPAITSLIAVADRIVIDGSHSGDKPFMTNVITSHLNENDYRANKIAEFDHRKQQVTYRNLKDGTPAIINRMIPDSRELFSALYFLRAHKHDPAIGDSYTLPVFDMRRQYELTLTVTGSERLATKAGTFDTLKLSPTLTGIKHDKKGDTLTLWVTNDGEFTPVKFAVDAKIGSFTATLTHKGPYAQPSRAPVYLPEQGEIVVPPRTIATLMDDFLN